MADRTEGGPSTFQVKVDDGPEQTITVNTGIYRDAAAAVPALLGYHTPIIVEIWSAHLVPKYGPYLFEIRDNRFGSLETVLVVRTHD